MADPTTSDGRPVQGGAALPVVIMGGATIQTTVSSTVEVTNDAGNPLPVSGTVTADTELPAAAALADAAANPTTPTVGADNLIFNGATWDRQPGNTLGQFAQGNVAHDAADSGNPVKIGAKASDTAFADVTANDRVNLWAKLNGALATYMAYGLNPTDDIVRAVTEGYKTTYSAGFAALAPAVAATDILEIVGSATKTVRILRVQISGVATAAGAYNVQLIKRSAAATGGTSSSATIVPHDSANAAGTAVVKGYTANPTVGAIVGIVRSQRITVSTGAGAIPIVPVTFDFTTRNGQGIVLRGVAQTLCLNLAAATMTGGLLDIDIEFSEE